MTHPIQDALNLAARFLFVASSCPRGWRSSPVSTARSAISKSVGLPLPAVGAALAVIVEIGASVALLAGFGTRIAALVLAVFTLTASVFFHAYWAAPADQAYVAQLLFFKNVAVAGGLLALAAYGAGRWSLDARRA